MRENSEASDPEMSPQAVLDEALARLEASRGRASRLAALEQLAEVVNDRDWTEPSSEASLPDVIEPLREAATDSDPEVAEAAIEALEPIGTTDSAGALGDVLASNASEDTKLLAIDAILTYDGPGSAQALARGLADPNTTIREEVAWALGWTYDRDRSALAALVQAERAEPDESIRDTMDQSIEDIEWDLN